MKKSKRTRLNAAQRNKRMVMTALLLVLVCAGSGVLSACGKAGADQPQSAPEAQAQSISETGEQSAPDDQPQNMPDDQTQSESAWQLAFSVKAFDGTAYTQADFADAKVIMLNLWEPWCGPCCAEMPDLERLYEDYKEQGLVILGVFSTADMDEDVKAIAEQIKISYPLLRGENQFEKYMTLYVPTTWFFRGDGTPLSEEPEIGSHEYTYWEAIVKGYLEG